MLHKSFPLFLGHCTWGFTIAIVFFRTGPVLHASFETTPENYSSKNQQYFFALNFFLSDLGILKSREKKHRRIKICPPSWNRPQFFEGMLVPRRPLNKFWRLETKRNESTKQHWKRFLSWHSKGNYDRKKWQEILSNTYRTLYFKLPR